MGGGISTSENSSSSWSKSLSEYFSNSFSNESSNSVSNSASQNQSTSASSENSRSQSTSVSGTKDSAISNTQANILENREQQYNNTYFPELVKAINEQTPGTAEFNALQAQQTQAVNASFDAAQKASNQTIAQMGIGGATGSGTQAALTAANERARSAALAQAYFNTVSQQTANKQNLLSLMGDSMTKPTTDTGYQSYSNSQSTSESTGSSASQSTGSSESNAVSTSEGNSQSESSGASQSQSGSKSSGSSTGVSWKIL